jgi:superfamily I DNA/RNA helicase
VIDLELASYSAGNLAIEAVPGAGKTSVIVRRLAYLVREAGVAPEHILALTYSRRAVRELRDRIARALPQFAARLDVRSFHGFALRLLGVEQPGFTSGKIAERPVAELLLQEAFASTEPSGFAPRVMRSPAFARDAERYVTDLQRAGEGVRAQLAREGSARLRDLIAVAERLTALRRQFDITDYDDFVVRAAALAADPRSRVHAWLDGRYRHVVVDEFQDTDPQQVRLIESLHATVFAVGDPAQAIYGFRGAARDAIASAAATLDMHGARLEASRRCPQAICDLVNAIPGLPSDQRMTTVVDRAGKVSVEVAATPIDEASIIAEHVAAAHEAGVPLKEIAVLLRSLDPLGEFVRSELERRGLCVAMSGGDAIVHEAIVRALLDALRAVGDPANLDRWIDLFASPMIGYPRLRAFRALHLAKPGDIDAACDALSTCGDGRVSAETMRRTLLDARADWEAGDIDRAARRIALGLDLLGAIVDEGDGAARRAGRRLRRSLDALDDIARTQRQLRGSVDSGSVLASLIEHSARWPDEPKDGDDRDEGDAVRVLTVHASKGLEFDTVVLADAADGRLPVELRREAILEESDLALARRLGCDLGATPAEHIEEERSLYYVAATRSKRNLVVTFSTNRTDGSPQTPSRFLPLSERDRLVEVEPYRAPLLFDGRWKAPPDRAARPVTLPKRVNVTRLDDWFKCPRKFFYSAVLGLPSERAFTMTFGILVHGVLQRFHRDHRRVDGTVDAAKWIAEIHDLQRDVWTDAGFDWQLERDAASASARRMLASYVIATVADGRDRPFTVEAIEHRIEIDLDGTRFAGRVDRLDRFDDGTTRIVDYKTSKMYASLSTTMRKFVDAVAEDALYGETSPQIASVQLPMYRRALGGTPDVELLYLRGNKSGEPICLDDVKGSNDDVLFAEFDRSIDSGFLKAAGSIGAMQRTTGDLRECDRCNFYAICDGSLEAVNPEE